MRYEIMVFDIIYWSIYSIQDVEFNTKGYIDIHLMTIDTWHCGVEAGEDRVNFHPRNHTEQLQ